MNALIRVKGNFLRAGLNALIITSPGNYRYLSGFTGSSGFLLLTEKENILVTDFRYTEQAGNEAKGYLVYESNDSIKTLCELTKRYSLKKIGLEKEITTLSTYEEYTKKIPEVDFVPVGDPCKELRKVKSHQELVLIKKAVEIADKAFLHILGFLKSGKSEKEAAIELEFSMRRLGAEKNAFETIVASGERSALPHGAATDKVIARGELVTLDFGAVYRGYHSDMTRTLVMGQPDARQQEIYSLVLHAQETALKSIKPGLKACEVDAVAREVISKAGYGDNFGHGLGHGVGLDIHEGPRLSVHDKTVLRPGMVVTVEPGIYIKGWGGIRIEDIAVVTASGCDILTKSPKNINEMIIDNK